MKINWVVCVSVLLLVAGIVYYLQHHKISMNIDIQDTQGAKSHVKVKHEIADNKAE